MTRLKEILNNTPDKQATIDSLQVHGEDLWRELGRQRIILAGYEPFFKQALVHWDKLSADAAVAQDLWEEFTAEAIKLDKGLVNKVVGIRIQPKSDDPLS